MTSLPLHGESRESINARLDEYRAHDLAWRTGRTFGFVYDAGPEVEAVGKAAYAAYLSENGLDPTSFPSLARLENEVLAMAREQLGGDADAVGAFTSGGTDSILLAVKAARDLARATRPHVTEPELVVPLTAHAAFHKAAHYLGVKAVVTPVDATTFRADVAAMRAALNDRTILVVGSAPSYAHGVVDPIEAIAALAASRDIPCHVDACVGGWLLPYFRRLGDAVPAFDLRVPGVTSISMDLHKFAFTPKGASVVMYRRPSLRRHQIYACASWAGYSVVNLAVQSSKSGGPVAAAWAVMRFLGDDGYCAIARAMRDGTAALRDGIPRIPGLRVLGSPDMSLLAFASDDEQLDVFHLVDAMKERGWYVQPQFRRGPSPANVHLSVGPQNERQIEAFLRDLRDAARDARTRAPSTLAAHLAETFATLDPRDVGDETIAQMMSAAGAGPGALPQRMADVHQLLNSLPPELVERILVAFFGSLFR